MVSERKAGGECGRAGRLSRVDVEAPQELAAAADHCSHFFCAAAHYMITLSVVLSSRFASGVIGACEKKEKEQAFSHIVSRLYFKGSDEYFIPLHSSSPRSCIMCELLATVWFAI